MKQYYIKPSEIRREKKKEYQELQKKKMKKLELIYITNFRLCLDDDKYR